MYEPSVYLSCLRMSAMLPGPSSEHGQGSLGCADLG